MPITTTPPASAEPVAAHAVRDHAIDVDELRLHVRDVGELGAPPVVVLHGIMGHAREWDPLVGALAADHRVLAVDQRGHGVSSHADDYALEPMAADVVAVLDALGITRTSIVGHSMGGMIALALAARHPERVDRVVVLDVVPGMATAEAAAELSEWIGQMAERSYAAPDEAVAEWLAGDPLAVETHMRRYVEHCLRPREDGRLVWRFDAARIGRFVTEGVTEAELHDAVDRLRAPLLVVTGEHSPFTAAEAVDAMVRRTGARAVEIPGAAHDLGVEQPEAVAAAVVDFLSPG